MWPGFDFRTVRHMWVEFVVGSHPWFECLFFLPVSSLRKSKHSKIQFDLEKLDEEQPRMPLNAKIYNFISYKQLQPITTLYYIHTDINKILEKPRRRRQRDRAKSRA